MKSGDYVIIKMVKDGETTTLFFLPDSLRLKINYTVRCYEKDGYSFLAEAHVDRETYLNEKLNDKVRKYCEADKQEQYIREQYRQNLITSDMFYDAISFCQNDKWVMLRLIERLIRKCAKEDLDVYNEIAIQLVDQYRQAIV